MPASPVAMDPRTRLALLWFVVALVPRMAYLVEQGTSSVLFFQPLLDEHELARTADDLLAGRGFGAEPLFKAPLYPVVLAAVKFLCGDAWFWGIRALQHLCGALVAAMAFDSAARLCGPGRRGFVAANVAAFIVAFHGPLIRLECQILLDAPAVFLQSAMLWALLRWRCAGRAAPWLAVSGLCAALAWLNRPTIMVALPFVAAWTAAECTGWRLRRGCIAPSLRSAALFLALPLVAGIAVFARNATAGGEAMLLPWQGGFNLYEANRTGAHGRYLGQTEFALSETGNPTRTIAESEFRAAVARGDAPAPDEGRYFSALDSWWKGRALDDIRADPARWIGLMARKGLDLASDREIYNLEDYDVQKGLSPLLRWMPLSFGWIWPPALASLALVGMLPRRRRGMVALMWLYAATLGGGIALYYTSGRMRMPLVFPAALLAAMSAGAVADIAWSRTRRQAMLAAFAALLVVGAFMSWGDWGGVRSESFVHAEYARLSNAAWRAGRNQLALGYAEKAERAKPGYAPLPQLRAQALFSLGRHEEAEKEFAAASEAVPGDATAPFNLGVVRYYHTGRVAEAAAAFEEALRRRPDYHKAAWMAALAHVRLGEPEAARALLATYDESSLDARAPVELLAAFAALRGADGDADAADRIAAIVAGDGTKQAQFAEELRMAQGGLPPRPSPR